MDASGAKRGTNKGPPPLLFALCFSLIAHVALLSVPRVDSGQGGTSGTAALHARLEAAMVEPITPSSDEPQALTAPSNEHAAAIAALPEETVKPPQPAETAPAETQSGARALSLAPGATLPLAPDLTYYPVGALDTPPRPLDSTDICYPEGASGEVSYVLMINEAGRVDEVSLVAVRPEGLFTATAVQACRTVKFTPAMKDGRAVRSRVRFVVGPERS